MERRFQQPLSSGTEKQFDKYLTDGLEHRIEGHVDSLGIFRGQVRAFAQWIPEECEIEPPRDVLNTSAKQHSPGAILIVHCIHGICRRWRQDNHTDMEFERYQELAAKYSGFMIFRDDLRVLPYGGPTIMTSLKLSLVAAEAPGGILEPPVKCSAA